MQWANNTRRYGIASRVLHLGMALLIMLIVGLGWYGSGLPNGPGKGDVFYWHKSLGALVLLLLVVRLLWHRLSAVPPVALRGWQAKLARAGHHLLYLLMAMMPLSGILMSLANGREVAVFNWLVIGGREQKVEWLGAMAHGAHLFAANVLVAMVGLHVAAALYHRLVAKDGVWERMFGRGTG